MSCLDATFTLTPRSPYYSDGPNKNAMLYCYGADFRAYSPDDFSSLYASNQFFFDANFASDWTVDYTQPANLIKARFLMSVINLTAYSGALKQLALIFGFDAPYRGVDGRVLVYSNAGLLPGGNQKLVYGDNQFLLEVESLDLAFTLYFIHAGGDWFFRGLSGYVV